MLVDGVEVPEEETPEEEIDETPEGEKVEDDEGAETPESDDTEPDKSDDPEQGIEDDPDGEEDVDFATWAAHHELPDGVTDVDGLATSYKEAIAKMRQGQTHGDTLNKLDEAIKASGYPGIDYVLNPQNYAGYQPPGKQPGQQVQQNQQPANMQPPSFRNMITDAVNQGHLREEDTYALQPLMPYLDYMFQTVFSGMANTETNARQFVERGIKGVRGDIGDDTDWARFSENGTKFSPEQRQKLKVLKDTHKFGNYEEAMLWANLSDPTFQAQQLADTKKAAIKTVKRRLRTDFTLKKGQTGGRKVGHSIKEYIMPDGDLDGDKLQADLDSGAIDDAFWQRVMDSILK